MAIVTTDTETGEEYIETSIRDCEGKLIKIINMKGYAATDIAIDWEGGIDWDDFDLLILALQKAKQIFQQH